MPEIRKRLDLAVDAQIHLDRRLRDLDKYFLIDRAGPNNSTRYVYRGERKEARAAGPNLRLRAAILHAARGRCGMCGRSVEKHDVTLVVDHKIPQHWGGTDEPENLWAICEECNSGKKSFFASFDSAVMRKVMTLQSPHMRIGELLKLNFGKPVESWMIEFVAGDQDDWPKRTRELRYLGWKINVGRKLKTETGRVVSVYTLKSFKEWPEDPTSWIRKFEAKRALGNKKDRSGSR